MPPRQITVGDIIAEHRRSYPDRLALADGEVHLTWPELDDRVNRLANALRETGVGRGDRILWLGQNSFRVYELLGAAAKIGAMVCPGYWRWAAPEMAFAIEDFSPEGGDLAGGGDRQHGARGAGRQPSRRVRAVAAPRYRPGPGLRGVPGRRRPGRPRPGYRPGLRAAGHLHLGDQRPAVRLDAVAHQPDRHGHVGRLAG